MALFDNVVGDPELKELANKMAAHILGVASTGDPDMVAQLTAVLAGLANMASGLNDVFEAMNPKKHLNEEIGAVQEMLKVLVPKPHVIFHHVHDSPQSEDEGEEGMWAPAQLEPSVDDEEIGE